MQTVENLCNDYIEHRKSSIKASTVARYKVIIYNYISPQIGRISAKNITRQQTEQFYKDLAKKGLTDNTIHDIGIFLRSVYNWANTEYGYENNCKQVSLPRLQKKTITILTDCEKQIVLKYGDLSARLALLMGLRIGEVCGIMGQDIEDGVLTVNRTVQRIQDKETTKVIITPPKTENSRRQIPVPKQIADELITASENYIITGCKRLTEPRVIQYQWKQFCKKRGLRDTKFHTLRHTFATTALEAGVDVKTLSEMLGHANVSTTMDLYCHPTLKHKQECMKKIWEIGGAENDKP